MRCKCFRERRTRRMRVSRRRMRRSTSLTQTLRCVAISVAEVVPHSTTTPVVQQASHRAAESAERSVPIAAPLSERNAPLVDSNGTRETPADQIVQDAHLAGSWFQMRRYLRRTNTRNLTWWIDAQRVGGVFSQSASVWYHTKDMRKMRKTTRIIVRRGVLRLEGHKIFVCDSR